MDIMVMVDIVAIMLDMEVVAGVAMAIKCRTWAVAFALWIGPPQNYPHLRRISM